MRNEQEMYDLILRLAHQDERIRAVMLNGSRANPNAPQDIFQDYDIVYFVDNTASFINDPHWVEQFGPLIIMQTPDRIDFPERTEFDRFAYLMQFADGNRIDLSLYAISALPQYESDSLSVMLLDKDNLFGTLPTPDESDYLPQPPTAAQYAHCCNEFWWVSTYVAKGLWRREVTYAQNLLELVIRKELFKMLTWQIGLQTDFAVNPGKVGKYFEEYLEPQVWQALLTTYADGDLENIWEALLTLGQLFRASALAVGRWGQFDYPTEDDQRVTAHLAHVRALPRDAQQMY